MNVMNLEAGTAFGSCSPAADYTAVAISVLFYAHSNEQARLLACLLCLVIIRRLPGKSKNYAFQQVMSQRNAGQSMLEQRQHPSIPHLDRMRKP